MVTSRIRSSKRHSYKKVYYIVTEGKTTEPSYFRIVRKYIPHDAWVAISCKPADKSSIASITDKARSIAAQNTHERDEIWVVADQDPESHLHHQFSKLMKWINQSQKHHIAISVPRFEFWLLCHFEDSPSMDHARSDTYVAHYLPDYDRRKDLVRHSGKITIQNIRHAIRVACRLPECTYNSSFPGSDVWKLVQALLTGE